MPLKWRVTRHVREVSNLKNRAEAHAILSSGELLPRAAKQMSLLVGRTQPQFAPEPPVAE